MELLDAFAPAEAPPVAAGALMMGVAAWLLYLDFNHRVVRSTALFLAVRGFDNILAQYINAPGLVPPDWVVWARVAQYLPLASMLAAAWVALTLLDPPGRARWRWPATLALAAGSVVALVSNALLLPRGFPFVGINLPDALAWLRASRFAVYALLALLLVRAPAPLQEMRARALAGFAFLADPLFLAAAGIAGYPLGIQPAVRGFLGLTPWILLAFAPVLALAAWFPFLLRRRAREDAAFAPHARNLGLGLAAALAGALGVVACLAAAPSLTLPLFSLLDALWTAALPVLFGIAVVQGHLLGIRQRVRRTIRQSTVLTVFLGVFLAASELARAFTSQGVAPYLGLAATGVLLLAVGRLQRLGDQMAHLALGSDPERTGDARRLDAYRAALLGELGGGGDPAEATAKLRPLRAELGISDRDHAVMLHLLRSGAAPRAQGLHAGELFLGRYRVQRELGQGGAGKTHLCRDERVGRDVVVKALRSAQGADSAGTIVREARAIGNLNHPNVVTLHDIEQVGDEAFIVMEHLPGGSLAKRLERGPLTQDEFRRVSRDLLAALGAVHQAGIVHRDVKPSNILLTAAGRAKLADFGVAHLPGFETTVAGSEAQGAVGTIRFMSPEQALGHPATPRSDLYGAAATLYEALTGQPYLAPRPGESAVELQMRAATVQGFDRDLDPPALRAWFERALQPRAGNRFQDADAMVRALDAALDGPPRPRASSEPAGSPSAG